MAPPPAITTWIELLRWRAEQEPKRLLYTFLTDGETEAASLTNADLERRARAIGGWFQAMSAAGGRALLLHPPGLDYIAALFGCLYAGVVAVPAYPPHSKRLLPRVQAIVSNAQPTIALTDAVTLSKLQPAIEVTPQLTSLRWVASETLSPDAAHAWHEPRLTSDSLALLQYTSGSTGLPKGVMLTHGNLLYNARLLDEMGERFGCTEAVSWLPPYHDLGLIIGILRPLFSGVHSVLMSPLSFLQRPGRWLRAISRYRAEASGGPNFAYELCVQKVTPEQRASLDLSSWRLAFNGAEPVRRQTLERFVARFEPCGFRRDSFYPCYGLAEATLFVSGRNEPGPPIVRTVQREGLEHHRAVNARAAEPAIDLVGCGGTLRGQRIVIVNSNGLTECPPDEVGEIWVSGPSVARGYWNEPLETARTFMARLADGRGPFLRTGDTGFLHDGELFITGRLKDLIIINGQNHWPQDIELTVAGSHSALRPDCGAAFSVETDGAERLVVVHEVESAYQLDTDAVIAAIRRAIIEHHGVPVYAATLVRPGSIPKTSSGKLQRHACRAAFLAGTLPRIAEWRSCLPPRGHLDAVMMRRVSVDRR